MPSGRIERSLTASLLLLLAMLTGVFTWTSLGMVFHLPLTLAHVPLASLLTWALLLKISRGTRFEMGLGQGLVTLLAYAGLLILFAQVGDLLWDQTVDGRWYHAEGIMRLAQGWNPIYDRIPLTHPDFNIYVHHYPKSEWILFAGLTQVFGSLEKAKALHFLLHGLVCALSPIFFKHLFGFRTYAIPLLAGLLLLANPIFLAQAFTFYNDADLATGMVGVLMIFYFHSQAQGKDRFFLLAAAFPLLAFTAHIKFTGLVYLAFMLFFYLLLYAWQKKKEALSLFVYLSASLVLILGFIGFHPLVTNTLEAGHPFHPLMGPEAVDIMATNTPDDLEGLNPIASFFLATFADPAGSMAMEVEVRPEGFLVLEDPAPYGEPDPRIRGFGFYSPWILLALLVALPLGLIFWKSPTQGAKAYGLYAVLVLLAIALLGGQMWWARYIAFLWFLVPMAVCSLLAQKQVIESLLAFLLVVLVALNGLHFTQAFLAVRLPAQDQVRDEIRTTLQAPPENPDGTVDAGRYAQVYTFAYWYQDKIKTMEIDHVEEVLQPALTRDRTYQPAHAPYHLPLP